MFNHLNFTAMKTNNLTIENVYNENYERVLNYILKRGVKYENAEELTSDVFISASKHLCEYNPERAQIITWLCTIANNKIIDLWRKGQDQTLHISDYVNEKGEEIFSHVSDDMADDEINADYVNDRVQSALASLKPKYRDVAKLFFLEQKTHKEICNILNITLSNTKVMINRVRAMLQESLQDVYTM